ncbi:MAG: hypothetical protein SPK70_05830, partial [Succinivibrio dextrinosolvens]|nr:hypothetical protein [Succinivibrio dextrinosolvens]
HPDKSKALYFVAKGISPTEGHVFSNTLTEHNKAVAEYRKKVKNYKLFDGKVDNRSENESISGEPKDNKTDSNSESINNDASIDSDSLKKNENKETNVSKSLKETTESENISADKVSVSKDATVSPKKVKDRGTETATSKKK